MPRFLELSDFSQYSDDSFAGWSDKKGEEIQEITDACVDTWNQAIDSGYNRAIQLIETNRNVKSFLDQPMPDVYIPS